MNLLANQLTLAGVELRNNRNPEAYNRLKDTCDAYQDNPILHNNLAVANYLNKISKNNQQQSHSQTITSPQAISSSVQQSFNQSILLNPLNYIPYYNLFNFYARQNNLPLAYPHLIEAIAALYLQKGLKQRDEKIINLVNESLCQESVLVYLLRAIVHVKNQKYIFAVSDLMWIVQKVQNLNDKAHLLQLVKMIFGALGQKDKQQSIQKDIDQLNLKSTDPTQNHQKDQIFKLVSTCSVPNSEQALKSQLSKRLKEFAQLMKEKECKSLKTSNTQNQVLFKQINATDLLKTPLNKSSLLRLLKGSIQESPLYTKQESKVLSRSGHSVYLSVNQSQQFGSGLVHNAPTYQNLKVQTSVKKLSMTTKIQNKIREVTSNNSIEESPSKKLNLSLNTSGLNSSGLNNSGQRSKKKTQNIYPLQKPNQQVQIKLVMARLTNNKQLLGNMDPYCILTYNGHKKQSKVIKGGGLNPNWRQSFNFSLTEKPSGVKLEVYDKEGFFKKDDFVGSGVLMVENNGFFKVQIFQEGKEAGIVFVTIESKI